MSINRRKVLAGAAAASASLIAKPTLAQNQPIKIIYPFAPGGGGDGVVRYLADQMRQALGETVIVENRVGADGRIGVRAVTSAPPDGRTFLFSPFGPIVVQPSVYTNLPYNPLTDLVPVAQVCTQEFALSTGPMTGAKNLDELVKWLRANPDKAAFGSPGAGTIPHFSGVIFANAAKVELRHVPFRGTAPVLNDLVAGQIALASTPAPDAAELHKSGQLRVLATTGAERSSFMPDVPTYKEQGYDIVAQGWYAFHAPAHTPQAIVEKVGGVLIDAVKSPAGKEIMIRLGQSPTGKPGSELAVIQKRDFEFWAGPIKASGFKPTD
ncbi:MULTISPECIES: tripartite tricarboxylate transporter substrate-binding protein [unclassified Beijerinckia]|uniref:Bug family tripartite tricarboxylate transporter substrate binding protein n=1 Tax=unclassified Beijerinckia TaxID=2638183 RepID=UPI00089C29C1|nr:MULTISPECIES: tripartite tricarboxylate transporter substrate-binding protein [unclassified Beijerinckia]MDH7799345.1 tripartite-type tricarboxylate transporter receptor subunit TctC [Beijerinckia sp. GAS462]SED47031.1 Tripartite-type tricarboxylate transporter, receptor component TctC [Beijerinckia sp. 28-YEA-48]